MLTEQQRQDRKLGIGGSDVAAILGLSKWSNVLDIYNQKTDDSYEFKTSERMQIGSLLESALIDAYEKRTGNTVQRNVDTIVTGIFRANVDGLVGDDTILECKTVNSFMAKEWGKEGTDEIPDYYLLQVAHYCMTTERQYAHIIALFGVDSIKIYKYERNLELEAVIKEKCEDFWSYVERKEEPLAMLDDAQRVSATLANSTLRAKINVGNDDIMSKIDTIRALKAKINELSAEIKEHELAVKQYLIEHNVDKLSDAESNVVAQLKKYSTSRFDSTKFKKEHDALYNQYVKTSEVVSLTIR